MINNRLIIVGAGQYGILAKEIAESIDVFTKIDFVDDQSPLAIQKTKNLKDMRQDYDAVVVAIGDHCVRLQFLGLARDLGYKIVTLVHPKAYVSPSAKIGEGCIVEPNVTIQTNVTIGEGCIISSGAVINHNAIIEKGCHVDCNATVSARSVVQEKTKIESGQVY